MLQYFYILLFTYFSTKACITFIFLKTKKLVYKLVVLLVRRKEKNNNNKCTVKTQTQIYNICKHLAQAHDSKKHIYDNLK